MSMNKRGQSLVTFILIIPLITLFLAFFIDSSLMLLEKNKIDGVIKNNMEISLKENIRDTAKIKNVIKKNIDIDVTIDIVDDTLKVIANGNKKSVFSKILDFSWYKLEFNYCGNYLDKKIEKCR